EGADGCMAPRPLGAASLSASRPVTRWRRPIPYESPGSLPISYTSMIDLSYLENWAWETEYLAQVSAFIPGINAIAIHWKSETLFRRWFPRLRSKYIHDKLIIPPAVNAETAVIILSDELYRVPKNISALAVFKQYVSDKDPTSIPFPLGVRRGFPTLTPKPIAARTIDAGFVGRTYPHRKTFLTELSNHP